MTQEFPSRGNWGAPGQLNPSTQLEGDQKTPAFPTRGFQSQYVPTAAEGVLGGAIYDLDPSKFDFFLKAGEDNEELRAQDQTVAEMLGKGAGRFALTTLTKTLEGIGFVGALPSALANWDLNKAVDNSFSEWFSELEEDIKEDLLPIYKTRKYLEGNILQQAGTLGFWMDDVVDGLAFFTSAWLGAKGINVAAKGLKGYTALAKLFSKTSKASLVGKAPIGTQPLGKAIAAEADLLTMSVGNSYVEAMFEAKDVKDNLISQGLSNEEASKAAMGTFGWNMLALMPSNYVTNSFLFRKIKPGKGRLIKEVDEAGNVKTAVKPYTFKNKAADFAKGAGTSVASEGPYEENIQLAIQNYFQDRAKGIEKEGQLEGILQNMADNFFTDEGQKSIFLGSVIGLIPGGIGGVRQSMGEVENEKGLSLLINTTLDAVRNDPAMKDIWLKTTDPKTKQTTYVTDDQGKPMADPLKVASYFDALYGSSINIANVFLESNKGDEIMVDRLREQSIASLAFGLLFHPDGQTQFDTEIELMARNEIQRATKEGEEIDEKEVSERARFYKSKWSKYKTIYDNVTNNFAGLYNFGNTPLAQTIKNKALVAQYMGAIDQMFWNEQKRKLRERKSSLSDGSFEGIDTFEQEKEDIDYQIGFIDKFIPALRKTYKKLVDENYWEKKYKAIKAEADKVVEGEKSAAETKKEAAKPTEEKKEEPQVDITGKPVEQTPAVKTEEEVKIEKEQEEERKVAAKADIKEELTKPIDVSKPTGGETETELESMRKTSGVSKKYGDNPLASKSLSSALSDIDMLPGKSLHAFYQGELGDIFIDNETNEVVFKNAETGKETIITKTTNEDEFSAYTLKQLGIVPLKHTVFNIEVLDELDKITIEGKEFGSFTENPLSSIEEDENGWPVAVKLLDERGNVVRFTNPTLVAELAYTLELIEHVKSIVSDKIMQEKGFKSDFVVITDPKNKYRKYNLYRDPDGKITVLKVIEEEVEIAGKKTVKVNFVRTKKVTSERVIRLFYSDLNNAIQAAYAEAVKEAYRENKESIKQLKERQDDAIKRAIANSRPGTAKENIEAPAATEVHAVKEEQTDEKPENTKPAAKEPETSGGKPAVKEAEIVDKKVNELAEEQEAVGEEEQTSDSAAIEVEILSEGEGIVTDTEYVLPEKGVKHSYSSTAYKAEENPTANKKLSKPENSLVGYKAIATIDFEDSFWEVHDRSFDAIRAAMGTIVLSKDKEDEFNSFIDNIPIKLTFYDARGNKVDLGSTMYHVSGYENIVAPKRIRDIEDPAKRRKAYEHLQKEEKEKTRYVRQKMLQTFLEGNTVVFTDIEKSKGVFETGDNKKISEVFNNLSDAIIGIADNSGNIYSGDGVLLVGKGSPGNVFLQTKETCNGEPFNVKLNPTKLTEEEAAILYKAYRTAATSKGGFSTLYPDLEDVEGGLMVGEVINLLVLEGPITNQSDLSHNPLPRPHLIPKQLWLDTKTGYLHFGNNKINLRATNVPDSDIKKFIDHIVANKNHAINRKGVFALGKKINRDFRIGSIEAKKGDSYEQFIMRNGFIMTDVIKNPVTDTPFHSPVVFFHTPFVDETGKLEQAPATIEAPASIEPAAATETQEVSKKVSVKTVGFSSSLGKSNIGEGSVISYAMSGEEVSQDIEIGRVINDKFVVTSAEAEVIKDLEDLNNTEITNPSFSKKLKAAMRGYKLNVTVQVEELTQQEEPKKPVTDEDIAGEFTRIKPKELVKYRVGNVEKARTYLKNKFGNKLSVKVQEGIIEVVKKTGNVDAFGLFSKDLITLSDALEEGTEYHEAYHRVELLLLSPEQRKAIYKEAREKYKNLKNASETEIAEFLAEEYRLYTLGNQKESRSLGQKIKDFFRDLWDFIATVITGDLHITELDINNLFRVITKSSGLTGRLTYAKPNKESAEWLANRAFTRAVKGEEFKTISTTEQLDNIVKNIIHINFTKAGILTLKDIREKRIDITAALSDFESKRDKAKAKAEQYETEGKFDEAEAYMQLHEMFAECCDKFDTLLEVVKDQLLVLGINMDVEDALEDPEDSDDARGDNLLRYSKAHFEVNSKESAAPNIKLLVSTLRSTTELNPLTSLHQFVDFDHIWDVFQYELNDANTASEMLQRLRDKATTSTPHSDLLKRLLDPNRRDAFDTMLTQFFVTMKKNRNKMVNTSFNKKTGDHVSFEVGNAETQRLSLTYATAWGQAFVGSSVFSKGKPDKEYLLGVVSKYEELVRDVRKHYNTNTKSFSGLFFESATNNTIALFNSVSIPVDEGVLQQILEKVEGSTVDERLFNLIVGYNYRTRFLFGKGGTLEVLAKTGKVSSKGQEIPTQNIYKNEILVKDIVGRAYVASNSDEITNSIIGPNGNTYYLISENNFLTDTINNVHKGEEYLGGISNIVYNKNSRWIKHLATEDKSNFDVHVVANFSQNESSDRGRDYSDITKLEDYLLKIALLDGGYIPLPQLAERNNLYTIKGIPKIDFNYVFDSKNNKLILPKPVIDIFVGYIKDEYNRIQQVKKEIEEAKRTGDTTNLVKNYHYTKSIFEDTTPPRGMQFIHFPSLNSSIDNFNSLKLDVEVNRMLSDRIEEVVGEFTRLGIINSVYDPERRLYKSIRNRLLDENTIKKIKSVVTANDEGFAVKNLIANFVVNTASAVIETEKVFSMDPAYFDTTDNKVKRLSVLTSTGANLRLDMPVDILPGERLIHNDYFNSTVLNTQKYSNEEVYNDLLAKFTERGISEAQAKEWLKGYLNVDQTDAQAYITPQMRRAVKIRLGEWSTIEQKAYDLIMSGEEITAKDQAIIDKLYMEPLKFSYFGIHFTPGHGMPLMYKTSMATLTPQLVKGTVLEELYNRMTSEDPVDIAIFDTGVKVGQREKVNYLETKDGKRVEDEVNIMDVVAAPSYKLMFKNLRRQQITEPHMEQYGKLHTQLRKVVMSNIIAQNEYTIDGEAITGEELRNQNNTVLSELSNRGKTTFAAQIGFDTELNETTDVAKERDFITGRARAANMPETVIEALANGIEYDALPDRKWVQSTVIAQMGKHTADISIPGTSMIQMSNFGLRKADKGKDLKLYDKDGYMECMVSIEVFRNAIPFYNKLSEQERIDMANKMFVGVGYRIPTQGMCSVVPLKIVGFLPSINTDTIVLPAEFTTLTGSDFDIDKLYFIRYNYDKEGNKVEYDKDKPVSKQTTEALENRLIDIYLGVLLSNNHLIDTKTPLDASTKLLKDLAHKVETLEGAVKFQKDLADTSPIFQSVVKEKYLGGKDGIGPFALANVHHVLGQMAGLGAKIDIGGKNTFDLSRIEGDDNIPILTWLSALINAHVDVAKDPYIFSLNVNSSTYNAVTFLIRAGFGGELSFAFLSQPILKEYAELDAIKKGRIRSFKGKAYRFVKEKYTNELKKAQAAEKSQPKKVTPDEVFTLGNLYKDIKNRSGSEYYARQLAVLEQFNKINKVGADLFSATQASQIDTKRYGNNLMDIKKFDRLISKALRSEYLTNVDKLFSQTFLETFYNNTIKLSFDVLSDKILMGTKVFNELHDRMLNEAGFFYDISKNASRRIGVAADALYSSIAGRFFVNKLGYNTERVREMFIGDNTMALKILAMKNDPKFSDNRLLKLLNPVVSQDKDGFDYITLFNAAENRTKWHKDRITEGWRDLMSDPETETIAKDLVAYSFFASGFKKSLHSFYSYIPTDYLMEAGFSEYIKNVKESFKDGSTGEMLGSEIYYDALRNMWHNSEFVPFVNEASLVQRRRFKNNKIKYFKNVQIASDTLVDDENAIKIGNNILGDPVYKPFIKTTISGGTYLYRYVGFRTVGAKEYGVYVIDRAMGKEPKAGKVIVEHGLSDSIFEDNNTIKVEEKELLELNTIYGEVDGKVVYNYEGFVYMPSELSVLSNEYVPAEDEPAIAESTETTEEVVYAEGQMKFDYEGHQRPDVKSKSTLEAIINGERKASTRYEKDGNIPYWSRLKIGDIITWHGKGNETVLVRVTKPLTKLSQNTTAEEWSKKEGWSVEYFNKRVKPRLNEAYQIEYELMDEVSLTATNPKDYTIHSGGALNTGNKGDDQRKSADLVWEDIGEEYGVKTKAYSFSGHKHGSKSPVTLTKEQLKEADTHLITAARGLNKRYYGTEGYITNLLRRNWFQVKNADTIFAVGQLITGRTVVEGGTGWAVQMAIDNNKSVYVYDQITNGWYSYSTENKQFIESAVPVLTKNSAGIGTREISSEGIQAIRGVFEATFGTGVKSTGAPITKETSFKEITTDDIQENNELYKHCK